MPRTWFHLIASTYGSWLPGDPRGFRTWHHKEHVEGDYKIPPPAGKYDQRHDAAKRLQQSGTIWLPPDLRPVIGVALRQQFHIDGGRVLIVAVGSQHAHIQVQLDEGDARIPLGRAKMHAWFAARDHGWNRKLWAVRGKIIRIRDRGHQANAYQYILDHRDEGAWVWSELEQQSTEGA